jgi:uncharacterized protein
MKTMRITMINKYIKKFSFVVLFCLATVSKGSTYDQATQDLSHALAHNNFEQAEAALQAGADVNAYFDENGIVRDTPTKRDLWQQLLRAVYSGNSEAVVAALNNGGNPYKAIIPLGVRASLKDLANVMSTQVQRATLLYHAVRQGNSATVAWLVNHGASLTQESEGRSALHLAIAREDLPMVNLLLSHYNRASALDTPSSVYGDTALHLAAASQDPALLETLVRHGADIQGRRIFGDKPAHIVAEIGTPAVLERLLTYDSLALHDHTVIRRAADVGNIPVIRALIRHGTPATAHDLLPLILKWLKRRKTPIDLRQAQDLLEFQSVVRSSYNAFDIALFYGHTHLIDFMDSYSTEGGFDSMTYQLIANTTTYY